MRSLTLCALLLPLFVSACSGGNAAVGTYEPDFAAMKPAGLPPDQAKMFDEMMAKSKMVLTLKSDNTFTIAGDMMGKKMNASGTYTLAGDKLAMKTLMEDGKKSEEPEKVATFKDGTITISEGGQAMHFKRK